MRAVSLRTSSGRAICAVAAVLAGVEVEARARQRLAMAAERGDLAAARAVGVGAHGGDVEAVRRRCAGGSSASGPCRRVGDRSCSVPMLASASAVARAVPSSMPSLSQRICGRAANFALRDAPPRRACDRGSQGLGVSSCAMRAASPASSRLTSAQRRRSARWRRRGPAARRCAARRRSRPARASQFVRRGPAIVDDQHQRAAAARSSARVPSSGSASATISSAAAIRRSSSSHQGVCAGVSSSSVKPSSRRSGGNTMRRGAGGVTRSSHQIDRQHDQRRQNPGRAETQVREAIPCASRSRLAAADGGIERDQRGLRRLVGAVRDDSSSPGVRERARPLRHGRVKRAR